MQICDWMQTLGSSIEITYAIKLIQHPILHILTFLPRYGKKNGKQLSALAMNTGVGYKSWNVQSF